MTTTTFAFDADGNLKERHTVVTNAGINPMPAFTLPLLLETFSQFEKNPGLERDTLLMEPGMYAATAQALHKEAILPRMEEAHRLMTASLMNQIRIVSDKYCPLTVPRQFRFPRSKKKRIRKKWMKDRRNWRDERVVFAINTDSIRSMRDPFGNTQLRQLQMQKNMLIRNFSLDNM